jgi:hypothetical protein
LLLKITESEEFEFDIIDGKVTYVRIALKPIRKDDGNDREKPRLSGRVFDARTNKPIMAEVVLEPEFVVPRMNLLVLGIRWGQLRCNESVERLAKWDGFIQVTKGAVIPLKTVAWETGGDYEKGCDDLLYRQTNRLTLEWRSSTIPCWDGLIVLIAVPEKAEPAPKVTIYTEKWEQVFKFRELVDIHKIIPVDRMGNKVEIQTKFIEMPDLMDKPCKEPIKKDYDKFEKPPSDTDVKPEEKPGTDENKKVRAENTAEDSPEEFGLHMDEEQMMRFKEEIRHYIKEISHRDPIVTHTNEKGYYAFRELPSGHYRMIVHSRGYIEYYNEFTIKPCQHLYIDVYLRPMERPDERPCRYVEIKGQVTNARTNEPVSGAVLMFERVMPERPDADPANNDRPGPRMRGEDPNTNDRQRPPMPDEDPDNNDRPRLQMHDEDSAYLRDCPKYFKTMTNERGYFELELPVGMYKLTVKARGYEEYMMRLNYENYPPEFLKIELKPMTQEQLSDAAKNTDGRPGGRLSSDTDGGSSVDSKGMGVELLDDSAVDSSILALVVALLICGILIPLVLLARQGKLKRKGVPTKTNPKPKGRARVVKKAGAGVKKLNATKIGRAKPSFSKPIQDL